MTVESNDTQFILRLDGDCTIGSAAELKAALAQGLAASSKEAKDLCLDLGNAGEIDIAALQLLWAAQRAAMLNNRGFVARAPETVRAVARDSGFAGLFDEVLEVGQALEIRPALEG